MDTAAACALVVNLVKQLHDARVLAASRAEDIDSYRLLAQQSIHALAELTKDRDRIRANYHALLNERKAERRAA